MDVMNPKSCYLHSLLLSSFIFSSFINSLSVANDTLYFGQVLSKDQTISSKNGTFQLGLFSPGNSNNYYLGIWYKQISEKTVVWVANREKPLRRNEHSQLKINRDGNLVLLNQLKEKIWSTNVDTIASNSTSATLLDTGNLVLRGGAHPSVIHWQSFDHPTDTNMPRAEFGRNKITGERQRLVAWRNYEDPAPGLYSLEIDPKGTNQFLLLWNGSICYWTTGVWTGEGYTQLPVTINPVRGIVNISFIESKNKTYLTFNYYDSSILARGTLEPSGQYKHCRWSDSLKHWNCFWVHPVEQCEVYAVCGAFGVCNVAESQPFFCLCLPGFQPKSLKDWNLGDFSGGCQRKSNIQCNHNSSVAGDKDGYWLLRKMGLPANQKILNARNAQECELSCLSSCSCTAYTYNNKCLVWNGDLINLRQLAYDDVEGQDLYIRLSESQLTSLSPKKRRITKASLGAMIGAALVLFVTILLVWKCWGQQRTKSLAVDQGSLVSFSFKDLQIITKNFSEKLGKGSFGSVYKGSFPDSTSIAVKKLEGHTQGEKEFRAEVSTLGTIQHINLVCLRGFCAQGTNRLLVYDYMPNGSLNSHLFHNNIQTIDWNTRYQIALGTAKGLAYLHEECRDCIIHCDVKPENILLDATFCPKVSDFGMAKLVGREFSRVLTSMRGTIGYLAPEWISGVAITSKADVYSYGMMLFEIISGTRNVEQLGDGESSFFPCWASRKVAEGEALCLLDYKLEGNINVEELVRASRVACWCIQDDETERPSMGQVVQMLEGVIDVKLPPIPWSIKILLGDA